MEAVYRITHKASGTTYVGSTNDTKRRWRDHQSYLRRGAHGNPHLQAAWDKYGEAAFEWGLIEEVQDGANLLEREQYWLERYLERPETCYNIAQDVTASMLGRTLSEEARRKVSVAAMGKVPWNRGKKLPEETRRKISETMKGKPKSEAHKRALSEAMKGKKLSEEARRKLRKALSGENHPNWGKSLSKASRKKIGRAKARPYPAFVRRETGERIPAGVNLSQLCRERGLTKRGMWDVAHGKGKSHKGWILANGD